MKKIILFFLVLLFGSEQIFAQCPFEPSMFPSNYTGNLSITPYVEWGGGGNCVDVYQIGMFNGSSGWGFESNSAGSYVVPYENHLEPSSSYTFICTAWDTSNGSNNHATTVYNVSTGPIATLTLPPDGATEIRLDAIMTWVPVYPFPSAECVQISTSPEFTNIILSDTFGMQAYYVVPTGVLQDSAIYYWRVAENINGNWLPSFVNSFTTVKNPPVGVPYLVNPMNGGIISLTQLFDWDIASFIYSTSKLWFMMSEDINFSTLVYSDSSVFPSVQNLFNYSIWVDYVIPEGILNYNKLYYMRICPGNGVGWQYITDLYYFYTSNPILPLGLLYPANGSTNISLTPTLDWVDAEYCDNYWIEISKSTDDLSLILLDSTLTSSQFTIPPGLLSNNTTYYWKVNAKNIRGWGWFSEEFNFTTTPDVPVSPILLAPINGAVNQPLTTFIDWSDVPSATLYNLQISTDSVFINKIIDDSTITLSQDTLASGLLSNNTVYYWRVRGKNTSNWGSYSQVNHFTTVLPIPEAPYLNISAIIFTLTPLIEWIPTSAPELSYRIQISTDDNFTSTIMDSANILNTFMNVPPGILSERTHYYCRVNATNTGGTSQWSETRVFQPIVLNATLTFPPNGAVDVSLTPDIIWDIKMYELLSRLQISTDSLFGTTTLDTSVTMVTPKVTVPQGVLTPHQKYYWRANMSTVGHTGPWSDIWNFTTGSDVPNAPILISPLNGVINQPVNITFIWKKAIETLSEKKKTVQKNNKRVNLSDNIRTLSNYWFEYSTDSTFITGVFRDSSLTDTTILVSGLNNNLKYFWRVKGMNQSGWGNFSTVWNLTTVPPLPSIPDLASPVNGSIDISLIPTLYWNNVTYASSYNIQLSVDSLFGAIILDSTGITNTNITIPAGKLTTLTKYYWRVCAVNAGGTGSFSSVWNFTTIPNFPNAPILSQPINNSVNQQTSIIFKWFKAIETLDSKNNTKRIFGKQVGNKDLFTLNKYWLEYTTDSTFTANVIRDSLLTDTTKTVNGLNNIVKYFWRVKGKNQTGWGIFSDVWNFTTIPPIPSSPILLSPSNDTTNVSLTPVLDWNDVTYAESYRVIISTDTLFTSIVYDTSNVNVSLLTIPPRKLTGLTNYYWKVNAMNLAGLSPWSQVWKFKTLQYLVLNLKTYIEGFWNGTMQVQDTSRIYLANPVYPYVLADSFQVLLSTSGTGVIAFTKVPNGNYYIVIKHRNHIETWSGTVQSFITNAIVNYDFTTDSTKAYGNNMKKVGSVWVLFGGDPNQDGDINALDIPIFVSQFGSAGYLSCDFNGDGDVNALDVIIFSVNFGLAKVVPNLVLEPIEVKKVKQTKIQNDLKNVLNQNKNNLNK